MNDAKMKNKLPTTKPAPIFEGFGFRLISSRLKSVKSIKTIGNNAIINTKGI
ncbi:unnamed protein product [marine sediment metagenome]|uniref:Uncharacterized protein n=1 Tax=marine sediment metagenome TaxID=412755 RepID=X1CI80_9ZZZZ